MDDSKEWRDVVGYEGKYRVSEDGNVYSLLTNKVLRTNYCGIYPSIKLTMNGKQFQAYIHTIVAAAFLGERLEAYDINHIDGVKTNNHYSNLEYCSHRDNICHAVATGLLCVKGKLLNPKLTEAQVVCIRESLKLGAKPKTLAEQYNVSDQAIYDIKNNKSWQHITV